MLVTAPAGLAGDRPGFARRAPAWLPLPSRVPSSEESRPRPAADRAALASSDIAKRRRRPPWSGGRAHLGRAACSQQRRRHRLKPFLNTTATLSFQIDVTVTGPARTRRWRSGCRKEGRRHRQPDGRSAVSASRACRSRHNRSGTWRSPRRWQGMARHGSGPRSHRPGADRPFDEPAGAPRGRMSASPVSSAAVGHRLTSHRWCSCAPRPAGGSPARDLGQWWIRMHDRARTRTGARFAVPALRTTAPPRPGRYFGDSRAADVPPLRSQPVSPRHGDRIDTTARWRFPVWSPSDIRRPAVWHPDHARLSSRVRRESQPRCLPNSLSPRGGRCGGDGPGGVSRRRELVDVPTSRSVFVIAVGPALDRRRCGPE